MIPLAPPQPHLERPHDKLKTWQKGLERFLPAKKERKEKKCKKKKEQAKFCKNGDSVHSEKN
jgi:hypothetical protein